jgi:hypothetical protein
MLIAIAVNRIAVPTALTFHDHGMPAGRWMPNVRSLFLKIAGRQVGLAPRLADAICPAMCNDFGHHIPYHEYLRAFSQINAPLVFPTTAPNLEPRDDIWPTDRARHSAPGRGCRTGAAALGLPAGPAQRSARHQFSVRRPAVPHAVLSQPRTFSSSLAPDRRNRNGSSPRPVRTGSASPGSGARCLMATVRLSRS